MRREPLEARVRAVEFVVDPPFFDDFRRAALAGKQVLIEAFIAQPSAEAFHDSVLHRLARRDVVPVDLSLLLPCGNGVHGRLGAVVGDDHAGIAALLGDAVELARYVFAGERVVDVPAKVVDDAQDAEATTIGQRVEHEVEAAALLGGWPSAPVCPGHVCGRRAGARSAAPPCRADRASASSQPRLPASGEGAAGDSQRVSAPRPAGDRRCRSGCAACARSSAFPAS